MKVCQIEYSEGFGNGSPGDDDPDHPTSDWNKIKRICCFEHKEYCEFIVYLGLEDFTIEERLEDFVNLNMSEEFISECKEAIEAGYSYACFYA